MNEAIAQQDLAFQAALHMRHETFMARYPRKFKLAVMAMVALLIAVPLLWPAPVPELTPEQKRAALEERLLAEMAYAVEDVGHEEEPEYRKRRIVVTHQPKTEAEKEAAAENDAKGRVREMGAAPDYELIEKSSQGPLPIVSPGGRQPWQVYARPFNHLDPRPRISVVISDMGLSRVVSDAAMHKLPANVTLAFDAHSDALQAWLDRARQEGHETLLSIPMEPYDYPRSDPGSGSLLTTLPNLDNTHRLLGFLGKATGYIGITTFTGSRFTSDLEKMVVVMDELKKRGMMVFDARLTRNSIMNEVAEKMRVPVAVRTRQIDTDPTPEAIDQALISAEKTARVEGSVVVLAEPLPITIDRLALWAEQLSNRGFVLAPLSAVVH